MCRKLLLFTAHLGRPHRLHMPVRASVYYETAGLCRQAAALLRILASSHACALALHAVRLAGLYPSKTGRKKSRLLDYGLSQCSTSLLLAKSAFHDAQGSVPHKIAHKIIPQWAETLVTQYGRMQMPLLQASGFAYASSATCHQKLVQRDNIRPPDMP